MKPSLSYFPHSTNTFFERRIRKLLLEHQANGYLLYNYLKTEIFKMNGYYLDYDELLYDDISDWFKFLSKESVGEILNTLFEIGLFDKQIFFNQKILTSVSIQEDFVDIMKGMRRQYYINPEIRLLEYDYYESSLRIKDKDENIMKSSVKFKKLPQAKNNSSKNFGRITQTSEDFGCSPEISPKNDTDYIERKERKEEKEIKEINKEISLSRERDRLQEIFLIEKNYPAIEFEKFLNHYQKTGWVDKNGNRVKDPIAAARNWIQLSGQVKFYVKPEIHKQWKKVWADYKEAIGFDNASHLLNVRPIISGDEVVFVCSLEDREICEKNIEILKPILRTVFGETIKLNYRILVPDLV
jgi:hypothetical protein